MNKKILILIIVLFLLGGVSYAMIGNDISTNDTAQVSSATTTSESVVHKIELFEDRASPTELLIKTGEYVQFESKDGKSHNIGEGKGNDYGHQHDHSATGINSGTFAADEAYKVHFKQPGIYYFHDHNNANAFITVAVYN